MVAILQIKDLKMTYPDGTQALKGVSFDIHSGEVVAIIGASGSGKSTIMRCINRLITPTSGDILFDNHNLTKIKKKELREARSKIGMIFQNYNLVNRSSVLENVLHGRLGQMSIIKGLLGLYSEQDKQRALDLLSAIDLSEQTYKRADELSGGQKQRVGICRALAQNPKLMLADEPIASLDPRASKDVMEALVMMSQKENITCIINLHQVDIAKKYATRIIAVKQGELFFDGEPEKLTDNLIEKLYNRKGDYQHD